MSLDIGIIGLPQSGRTTIFNALTKGRADTVCRTPEGLAPHIGMTKVPEPRVDTLAGIFQPKKVTHAEVKYIDIGASVKDLAEDKGISGEFLNQLSSVDALINVVRAFSSESVPHTEGSLDVERDIATIELELAFSDMALLERRVQKIAESLKSAKPDERQGLLREQELIAKVKIGDRTGAKEILNSILGTILFHNPGDIGILKIRAKAKIRLCLLISFSSVLLSSITL